MRIAFIVHDFNRTWGHSLYTWQLASRFRTGNEVHVYCNTVDPAGMDGVHFHHVAALRWNAFTTILSFAVTGTLAVLHGRYDILHSQGLCGMHATVVTAHQCNRAWHAARRRMESKISWRERLFGAVISRLEHLFYALLRNSEVVAISHLVERDLLREYGCKAPISVIHHGVDSQRFSPAARTSRGRVRSRFGILDSEPVFLFAGDLRKGARQAIQALSLIPSGILLLVSRSPESDYVQFAEECGAGKRVVFAGPSESIEEFYGAADFFVLPTPYDPFALVATEAMSCGLPCVVSRAAGAAELIRHGENGLILEDPSDVEELAGHMRRLLAEPERTGRMSEMARQSTVWRTWDDVAARTMLVYQRYMGEGRAAGDTCESKSYFS